MLIGLLLVVSLRAAHELVGTSVLPLLVADLGGDAWAGPFFSAFSLSAALGLVAGGQIADRFGAARAFATGLSAFALGMLATGLAPSMPLVVAARAVEGFGAGMVSCVASVAVMRAYDDAARVRVLTWLTAAWVVPGLVAPSVAVMVAVQIGWRAVFMGLVPLAAVAAWLALPPLRKLDSSVAAASPAVARSRRGSDPALRSALCTRALVVFAFFGVESFLPLALTSVRAAAPASVALLLTVSAITWTTGAFVLERGGTRVSQRLLAQLGAATLALGIVGSTAGLAWPTPAALTFASWGLAGLGMGVAYTAATAAAMRSASPGDEGALGSLLGVTDALSSGAATLICGALIARAPMLPDVPPAFTLTSFGLAALLGLASAWTARSLREQVS